MRPDLAHPGRLRPEAPDTDTSTLDVGHHSDHVQAASRWLLEASGLTRLQARPLLAALEVLHDNALRHTASGLPGGSVRITLTRLPLAHRLTVTDNGPRPGRVLTFPVPTTDPARGAGLHRLTELALFWEWEGCAGGPLSVWAVFDRPTIGRI